ncbi:MAG: acetylxylan esterase [Chloroflexi bacterium]|nr:acetylxylan esterase [Chloroflexota bacterium]
MPLLFDMPLDELPHYQGRNPKPSDFDAFWDAGLAEMRAVDPKIEIIPADFESAAAHCAHLFFTGVGRARIHAKLLKPKQAPSPHPAVLMFHGYSMDSGDWYDKLGYAAQGYTVAALDCRGQGGLSEDNGAVKGWTLRGQIVRGVEDAPEKLYFRQVFLDAAMLARIVMAMPDVDARRVGAMGASQGGGLALACAALVPEIQRVATVYPFLCDYQRVWEIDQINGAYHELQEWFRRRDPLHQRKEAFFTQLGYIDVQHLAPRIRAHTLMATALQDTTCPPSTQFAAYNKISSSKQLLLYPDFGHEGLPGLPDAIFRFMSQL